MISERKWREKRRSRSRQERLCSFLSPPLSLSLSPSLTTTHTHTHTYPTPQVDIDNNGLLNAAEIAQWAQSNGVTTSVSNASSLFFTSPVESVTWRDVYHAAPATLRASIVQGEAVLTKKNQPHHHPSPHPHHTTIHHHLPSPPSMPHHTPPHHTTIHHHTTPHTPPSITMVIWSTDGQLSLLSFTLSLAESDGIPFAFNSKLFIRF